MDLIYFPKPDKKTLILIAFFGTEFLVYIINSLIDGIKPFESKFFDQICQSISFFPILIYKKIRETKNEKKENEKPRYTTQFKKFLDYFKLTIICSVDLFANLCYIIFDDQFKETAYFYNRETIQLILVLLFCKDFFENSIL